MVTGRRAFQGETCASLAGSILAADPPPMAVEAFTPPGSNASSAAASPRILTTAGNPCVTSCSGCATRPRKLPSSWRRSQPACCSASPRRRGVGPWSSSFRFPAVRRSCRSRRTAVCWPSLDFHARSLIALPVEILKGNGLISLGALSIYSTDRYCMVVIYFTSPLATLLPRRKEKASRAPDGRVPTSMRAGWAGKHLDTEMFV
jgi:hypothetical protein